MTDSDRESRKQQDTGSEVEFEYESDTQSPLLTAIYVNRPDGAGGLEKERERLLRYVEDHPELTLVGCYTDELVGDYETQADAGRDDWNTQTYADSDECSALAVVGNFEWNAQVPARSSGNDAETGVRSAANAVNGMQASDTKAGQPSGENPSDENPMFTRLMEDVRNGNIQCIVAANLSDLGGSIPAAAHYVRDYFQYMNVRVIAVNDDFDSAREDDMERLVADALKVAADNYSRKQSEIRCERSKKRVTRPGVMPNGTAPYGYLVSYESGEKSYITDPDTAPYVRMMFKWALLGLSCGQIAERMSLIGAPTPGQLRTGKAVDPSKWEAHAVLKIIQNPNYMGDICLGRMRQAMYKSQTRKMTSPEEWTVRRNTHEPLVTREDYEEVQRQLTKKSKRPGQKKIK